MTADTALAVHVAHLDDVPIIDSMMGPYLTELGWSGAYPRLSSYWQDESRSPYLIWLGQQPVGFALVDQLGPDVHELVEFCISPSFRGKGFGRRAFEALLGIEPGQWRIGVRKDNIIGLRFWRGLLEERPSVTISEIEAPAAWVYELTGQGSSTPRDSIQR